MGFCYSSVADVLISSSVLVMISAVESVCRMLWLWCGCGVGVVGGLGVVGIVGDVAMFVLLVQC